MQLPGDPVMLLSVVNTMLRDRFSSIEALASFAGTDSATIINKLKAIDYYYDPSANQFK